MRRTKRWTLIAALALAGVAVAESLIVRVNDLVDLRNISIGAAGTEVFFAGRRLENGQPDTATNLYRGAVGANGFALSRLTNIIAGEFIFAGVTGLDYPGNGTVLAYTSKLADSSIAEEVHLLDYGSGTDKTLAVDKEGCVMLLCVDCFTTCLRSLHVNNNASTVLYSAARNQPFYTVSSLGGTKRLSIYDGQLASSGQRVISTAGKVVFTSAAPFGPTFAAASGDVYTMNLDGTNVQQVTHFSAATMQAHDAVMSSDGSVIAFALSAQLGNTSSTSIWTVRSDGTGLRQLSDGAQDATMPSISSTGSVVTYQQGGQIKRVISDPFALTKPTEVTRFALTDASNAVISGDGTKVAFMAGPQNGLPAAVRIANTANTSDFSQTTPVYAPRFIFPSGIVSAAGYAQPSSGSLLTAYGVNLSDKEVTYATSIPLPMTLGGIEFLANLTPLPMHAVTAWQVNAQVPQSLVPATVRFQVRSANQAVSPEVSQKVVAAAPEAISIPVTAGSPLAAAVFPGTKTLVDGAHPASANDFIEVYVLGLGVTTPLVEAGVASPVPPATANVIPRVRIGGRDAIVTFAGLVPGLAGVYQVNVRVPAGLQPGYQPLGFVNADGSLTANSGIYVK